LWIDKESGDHTRSIDLLAAEALPEDFAAETQVGGVWFSPDGQWVAVQHYIGDPILLAILSVNNDRWQWIDPEDNSCFCVDAAVFSPDSRLLVFASGTDGGGTHRLERRRAATDHRLAPIEFPGYTVRHLAFSPDERYLIAVTFGGIYLYEHQRGPIKGPLAESTLEEETGPLAFCPDGNEFALLNGEEALLLDGLLTETGKVNPGAGLLLSLTWSPDGRLLVLGAEDGTVRMWDREAAREVQRYDWQIGPVSSVAFAPDGMTCAAGGEKGQIVVWDVAD
jgi:WD40 repeat protein